MIRRTIPELLAKYKLNPGVREIFVEGAFDKIVLRWFLNAMQLKDVAVMPIELIDVPSALLTKYGMLGGERNRIVALGKELSAHFATANIQAWGVVDADCDRLLGKLVDCDLVLATDYTCMEMYYLNPATLSKFLQIVMGYDDIDIERVFTQYSAVLKELFLIRAANEEIGLGLRWIPFDSSFRRGAGGISLDTMSFVRHLLENSQAVRETARFLGKIEDLRPRLDPDIRHHTNGHDFLALLSCDHGRKARQRGLQNSEAVCSALRGCLDLAQIEHEPLFDALRQRLMASARVDQARNGV